MYERESIDNPCQIFIAVNPKDYFEQFKNSNYNKKNKGVRKNAARIEFKDHAKKNFFFFFERLQRVASSSGQQTKTKKTSD